MDGWIINILMLIVGGGIMFLVLTLTKIGNTIDSDGELQVYVTEEGLYPVLAIKKEDYMLNKSQILLDVKVIESRK